MSDTFYTLSDAMRSEIRSLGLDDRMTGKVEDICLKIGSYSRKLGIREASEHVRKTMADELTPERKVGELERAFGIEKPNGNA